MGKSEFKTFQHGFSYKRTYAWNHTDIQACNDQLHLSINAYGTHLHMHIPQDRNKTHIRIFLYKNFACDVTILTDLDWPKIVKVIDEICILAPHSPYFFKLTCFTLSNISNIDQNMIKSGGQPLLRSSWLSIA